MCLSSERLKIQIIGLQTPGHEWNKEPAKYDCQQSLQGAVNYKTKFLRVKKARESHAISTLAIWFILTQAKKFQNTRI